jgi:hypothetical protein
MTLATDTGVPAGETAPAETTLADGVPAAETTPETKPAETTPETKPAETTPETKPAETTPETKPAETTPETKPAETTPETKPAAPTEYADFVMGEDVELSEVQAGDIDALAKDLGLTQEQAQKLADYTIKQSDGVEDHYGVVLKEQSEAWKQETAKDETIGGPKLAENMGVVKLAMDKFATDGFREILRKSGLGNNVDVLKFMHAAGKAISEDTIVGGGNPDTKKLSTAERIYGRDKQ